MCLAIRLATMKLASSRSYHDVLTALDALTFRFEDLPR